MKPVFFHEFKNFIKNKKFGFTYPELIMIIILVGCLWVFVSKVISYHYQKEKVPIYVYYLYKNLNNNSINITRKLFNNPKNEGKEFKKIMEEMDAKSYCEVFTSELNLSGKIDCEKASQNKIIGSNVFELKYDCETYNVLNSVFNTNNTISNIHKYKETCKVDYENGKNLKSICLDILNVDDCINYSTSELGDETFFCKYMYPFLGVGGVYTEYFNISHPNYPKEEKMIYKCLMSNTNDYNQFKQSTFSNNIENDFDLEVKPSILSLKTINNIYMNFVKIIDEDKIVKPVLSFSYKWGNSILFPGLSNKGLDKSSIKQNIAQKILQKNIDYTLMNKCQYNGNDVYINKNNKNNSYTCGNNSKTFSFDLSCSEIDDYKDRGIEGLRFYIYLIEDGESEKLLLYSYDFLFGESGFFKYSPSSRKSYDFNLEILSEKSGLNQGICSNCQKDGNLVKYYYKGKTSLDSYLTFDTNIILSIDDYYKNANIYYKKWYNFLKTYEKYISSDIVELGIPVAGNIPSYFKGSADSVYSFNIKTSEKELETKNIDSIVLDTYTLGTTNNAYNYFIYTSIDTPFSKGVMNKDIFVFEQYNDKIIPVGYLANNKNSPLKFDVITRNPRTKIIEKVNKEGGLTYCEAMEYTGEQFSRYCGCKDKDGNIVTQYKVLKERTQCENIFGCMIKPIKPDLNIYL